MAARDLSIKHKLTLTIMGVSLAAVLLTVSAISLFLIYDIRASKQQELSITATIAADRNRAALTFQDAQRASANLEIFRHSPAILAACVYDEEGGLFANYAAERFPPGCPQKVAATRPLPEGMATFSAFQGITLDGKPLGSVYVLSSREEVDAYVTRILMIACTVGALVLLASLLLAMYMQRRISQPILQLAAIARQITGNRNFALQAKVLKADEIGELATAFNDMLAEVRQRDQELMYVNETLEYKVLLRTRELQEAKRLAEQASQAKSEFLRNISHEFRTPLHAMISFSSYGIKEASSATREEQTRYFQIILKSSERLSRLVNEVLDVARFEQGEQLFTLAGGDIHDLLTRALEAVRPLLQEKQIHVRCERATEQGRLVCDHDRIIQVITNLLSNAIKFSPPESCITLRSGMLEGTEPASVFISCADQGVGVPESEKETIFEPFRQSTSTKTGAGGTGLGLAICRGIVAAHGGHIWAENNIGQRGTTFTFTLPCNQREGTIRISQNQTETTHENAA